MKKTGAFFVGLVALGAVFAASASAGEFRLGQKYRAVYDRDYTVSQYAGEDDGYGDDTGAAAISPSQAASIAKRSWPGSKVLRVQLLPSGVYAVTLKQGGEVSRVMVDATSGDLG
jgi:uncharacterized membrane protein YkoI